MKWSALVLGSGGAHGEFQIGAFPSIARYYRDFDFYAGVGVGSMHASVLAQYDDFAIGVQVLTRLWQKMRKNEDILDKRAFGTMGALISDKEWVADAAFGNQKLRETLIKHVSWDKLKGKDNWGIRTTSLTDGLVYTISNNEDLLKASNSHPKHLNLSLRSNAKHYIGDKIIEFILAAGMVPAILPPVDIFDHRFVEGGIRDVAPLQLAVQAFELAMQQGYTEAEFIVVNNYVRELDHELSDKLDSGTEILLRSIKIMTIEMAKNDLLLGERRLTELQVISHSIKTLQPAQDTPLHPMDFGDMKNREALRRHGQEVALKALVSKEKGISDKIRILSKRVVKHPADTSMGLELIDSFIANPEIASEVILSEQKTPKINKSAPKGEGLWAARYHPVKGRQIHSPPDLLSLKKILLKHAGELKKKVKPLGSGYAFSNILETTGINIRLNQMNGIFKPKGSWLKDQTKTDYLFEIETGNIVKRLNTELGKFGKTLLNQPGYEHLNYFGVCTTGGHGSGLGIGPIAEAIESMHLLTLDENDQLKEYKIEPTNGITDQNKFNDPGIELIQDDEVFNSVLVSAGCMGIVYSIIIKTQDSFYLEEKRTCEIWEEISSSIPNKLRDPNIHSVHLWFNPYKVKGQTNVVVSEYTRHTGPEKGTRPLGMSWNIVDDISPILIGLMNGNPPSIPKILNTSLSATVNNNPVVMKNPLALNFGSPNHSPVHATNFSVPFSRYEDYIAGMQKLAADRAKHGVYYTGPIGLRFTSSGRGYISPQFDQESCMVEVPLLQGTPHAIESINAMQGMAIKKYEGRPHWGQINQVMNKTWFKKRYPEWAKFIKAYHRFNKGHFDNGFTEQLGFRKLVQELGL